MIIDNNNNNKKRKDDAKILSAIIAIFVFVVWLCTPPGNKFAQVCFWGNNTQFLIAKLTKSESDLNEWKFYRNNAVYLAKMDSKLASLREMDKAIMAAPSYLSDNQISSLYAERAQLRMFWGEHKGALDDYLRVKSPSFMDKFKIALLLRKNGNYKEALSYCNDILNLDLAAYIGYACVADVYANVGRYDTSVRIFDLLIDKTQNRARYYVDRAKYKQKCGDISGYNADIAKAQELSPMVDLDASIIEETLYPKRLTLTILK